MPNSLLAKRRSALIGLAFVGAGAWAVNQLGSRPSTATWGDGTPREVHRKGIDTGDQELPELSRRIESKEMIIAELLAARVTLAEATDQFLALDQSRPNNMIVIRAQYTGSTDRERMALNVITFAQRRVHPRDRDAVARRLDAEFQQMFPGGAGK